MTSVLSSTEYLRRRDRGMSIDDNQIDCASTTDWREKYNEVADLLTETRNELDEFHAASKELEAELESELQRTEKAQQDLKIKVAKAETERDGWKSKFMTLQTNFNTTTTSLQRELDKLRQEHQHLKIQLRELEMGNDDLERNERAVTSSLADVEAKYSKALEEKILLEHELLDKANMEEELQRLKDELRDSNNEISIMKDQLAAASARTSSSEPPSDSSSTSLPASSNPPAFPKISIPSEDDNLLNTPPPPDLQLSELASSADTLSTDTPRAKTMQRPGQSALLHRAGFPANKPNFSPSSSSIARSTTLPTFNSPSASPRTPVTRRLSPVRVTSYASTNSTSTTSSTATRSKTMQMASAIRAKMETSLQKSFTRVPRLRKPSVMGRNNAFAVPIFEGRAATRSKPNSMEDNSMNTSTIHRGPETRRSNDSGSDKGKHKDSTGWVLIMEDSPSPPKDRARERRRISSPTGGFDPSASSPSPTSSHRSSPFAHSTVNTGIRRPQSRLSGASLSTATSTSSIPTPTSRPATPTLLPIPSGGLYTSTAGISGMKRSTGPGQGYPSGKRSSLGSTSPPAGITPRERPLTMPPPSRPGSGTPSSTASSRSDRSDPGKSLPQLPSLHSNVTMRQSTKTPMYSLAQSRIGRPSGGGIGGRRSVGETHEGGLLAAKETRQRAGSVVAPYGK